MVPPPFRLRSPGTSPEQKTILTRTCSLRNAGFGGIIPQKITAFVRDGVFHKEYIRSPRPLTEFEKNAVYSELSAQAERIKQAGINVVRADSHHYIHTIEHLAPIIARVCREQGIRQIRLNRTYDTPEHPVITEGRISNNFWRENGFITTENFGRLADLQSGIVRGYTEIMVHPDYDKSGELIDRRGTDGGVPFGEKIPLYTRDEQTSLRGYSQL